MSTDGSSPWAYVHNASTFLILERAHGVWEVSAWLWALPEGIPGPVLLGVWWERLSPPNDFNRSAVRWQLVTDDGNCLETEILQLNWQLS